MLSFNQSSQSCCFPLLFGNKLLCSYFQNYETTESRIKREFEAYGPIKRVGIIRVSQSGTQFCIWLGKIDEVFVSSCNLCLCVASVVPSFHNKVIHICLIAVFKGKKKWNYVLYCITNIMFWSLWQGD